jgi:hypothetical protein
VGTSDFDVCHSYTQALRHPVIIGHVAGWRLPWALSASQLGAIAAVTGLLLVTRPVWAHLGSVGNLAVFTVALAGTAWAVRHWRVEGRSPFLFAAGVATVLLSARCRLGVRNGVPAATPRLIRASTVGILVASTALDSADE